MSENKKPAAFISGAAQGIGAAIALAFAKAGYDLALSSTNKNKLADVTAQCSAAGARVAPVSLNVTDQASIEAGFREAIAALGQLDVLVNNAAITLPRMAVDVTREDWSSIMDTNLTGTFFMCQQMGRHLIGTKRPGTVISITSTHGVLGFPLRSTYGISKAAVMHMARMLAIEWAEHGIRVNTIAPGTVLTATRKEYADANPGYLDKMIARVPLKRTCMPEEIADAAVYLASPAASYITGQTLLLDGGLTSY
jgi:NAD(P)-dependent dehydrogenase (short-subunit alcohol dehydrogenase family)